MYRYLSVAQMISIEKAADSAGHTYSKMMSFAGRSLAEEILNAYGTIEKPTVLGLVGSGNNGGDTLVAMRLLMEFGWDCTAYFTSGRHDDKLTADFQGSGGKVHLLKDDVGYEQLRWFVLDCDILLDGLLGTGTHLPLRSPISDVLRIVGDCIAQAETKPVVVAVDCPSGVDCDNGDTAEECLFADLTVCMAAVKKGLLRLPAYAHLGKLVVGEIGLPVNLPELNQITRYVLDQDFVFENLPLRPLDGHKGTFGTALIIAGSKKLPGAVILAGKSAFRVGAGWINIAVHDDLYLSMIGNFPEATWLPLAGGSTGLSRVSAKVVLESLGKETAILVGPGFGLEQDAQEFMAEFVSKELPPLVVDADGLKLLAGIEEWWKKIPENTILTPHPGEMCILTGLPIGDIQADREVIAESFANQWGHVVVLKGAFTVIAEPGGRTAILPVATPALARAGTGDVLAGMITGLRAQGMQPFQSAAAGVWLHAEAGLTAAKTRGSTAGILAGDLIDMLPSVLPY